MQSYQSYIAERLILPGDPTDPAQSLASYRKMLEYTGLVAQAYKARPIFEAEYTDSWAALIESFARMFPQIKSKFNVQWVEENPYGSAEEMKREVDRTKVLKIWKGLSDQHAMFTEEQNWIFRAIHDLLTHIYRGISFGLRGELKAYNTHVKLVPPAARLALYTEVVGQVAYAEIFGDFGVQKIAKIWGVDYMAIGLIDKEEFKKNFPNGLDQPVEYKFGPVNRGRFKPEDFAATFDGKTIGQLLAGY